MCVKPPEFVAVSCTGLLVLYLVAYHLDILSFSQQWEYREGALPIQVTAILNGVNIYQPENLPIYFNQYGWTYPFISSLVCLFLGVSFPALRLVSALAIFGTLLLTFWHAARLSSDRIFAFAITVGLYVQLLHFVIPLSRPDGLGTLIYVAAIVVVERSRLGYSSSALVFLLSVVGFLTKPYFIVIAPLAFSYWALFVDFRKGLFLSLLWLAVGLSFVLVLNYFLPSYLTATVLSQYSGAGLAVSSEGWDYLAHQLKTFLPVNIALILILVAALFSDVVRRLKAQFAFSQYAFVATMLILILKLGHSKGAYLTYFIELATPPLVFTVARLWPFLELRRGWRKGAAQLATVASFGYASALLLMPQPLREEWKAQYREAASKTDGYAEVLAPPILAGYLLQTGRTPLDTGQNEYLWSEAVKVGNPLGLGLPSSFLNDLASPLPQEIVRSIAEGRFDLVVTDQITANRSWAGDVARSYTPAGEMKIGHWVLKFWIRTENRPITAPAPERR